jgi:hypothetical protein
MKTTERTNDISSYQANRAHQIYIATNAQTTKRIHTKTLFQSILQIKLKT